MNARGLYQRLRRKIGSLRANSSGMAAVEFAVLAPVVFGILAATADIGTILYTRIQVDGAINAAANYALVNASNVSAAGASSLATSLSGYIFSSLPGTDGGASVTVNNGSSHQSGSGATTAGGSGNADSCYCPTGSGASLSWGSSVTCGSACPNGGFGGKFVILTATKPFSPMFSNWGIVTAGAISSSVIVQVQ